MTTMPAERLFIDTNVLVYASIAEAPLHQAAFARLQTCEETHKELWISRQVLREYLAVLTRPQSFTSPIPTAAALQLAKPPIALLIIA